MASANNRNYVPVATVVIIVINCIVFAAEYFGPLALQRTIDSMALGTWVVYTGTWYTLLTSMFMHGGLTHILCNMFTLYWIGYTLERVYGAARYLVLYFVSGIVGGLAFVFINLALGNNASAVGASGAIFGLFGAYGYLIIRESRKAVLFMSRISKNTVSSFLSMLAINVFIGFVPGIAWEAHFGGLVAGVVTGAIIYEAERRKVLARYGDHDSFSNPMPRA